MKKNNAGFIQIILILVVISLVGGGMYYFGTLKNKSEVVIETPTNDPVAQETQKPGLPTVKPTTDPTAGWKIYSDSVGKFEFKYPANYILNTSHIAPYLNRTITWRFNSVSAMDCRGDCPVIEKITSVNINGQEAKKLEGYIGEVGGNVPQRFVEYEFTTLGKYFVISLQVTPLDSTKEESDKYLKQGKIIEFTNSDKVIFDQILSTFKFTN